MEYHCFIDYFIQLVEVRARDLGTCHRSVSVGVKVSYAHRTLQKLYRELLSMLGSHSAWELGLRLGKMSISIIPLAEREILTGRPLDNLKVPGDLSPLPLWASGLMGWSRSTREHH